MDIKDFTTKLFNTISKSNQPQFTEDDQIPTMRLDYETNQIYIVLERDKAFKLKIEELKDFNFNEYIRKCQVISTLDCLKIQTENIKNVLNKYPTNIEDNAYSDADALEKDILQNCGKEIDKIVEHINKIKELNNECQFIPVTKN